MAIILVSISMSAQDISHEEARTYAAQVLVNFKNTLEPYFESSDDFESFVKHATDPYNPTPMPKEGEELLRVTYEFFLNRTSDKEIISSYSGKEVAKAFKFLKDNPKYNESRLFGLNIDTRTGMMKSSGKGGPNADYEMISLNFEDFSLVYPCRWWQVRCHLAEIVGDDAADIIITALITILLL